MQIFVVMEPLAQVALGADKNKFAFQGKWEIWGDVLFWIWRLCSGVRRALSHARASCPTNDGSAQYLGLFQTFPKLFRYEKSGWYDLQWLLEHLTPLGAPMPKVALRRRSPAPSGGQLGVPYWNTSEWNEFWNILYSSYLLHFLLVLFVYDSWLFDYIFYCIYIYISLSLICVRWFQIEL